MKARLLAMALGLMMVLSGCGLFGEADVRLRADFQPTLLGFEIDDSGKITIAANSVQFVNPPGGKAATVTSYEVRVFDDSGTEHLGPGSDLYGGHLAISVPPGYVCAVESAAFCAPSDRIPSEAASEGRPFVLVAGPFAVSLLDLDLVRLNAVITFTANQGGRVVTFDERVDITYPVAIE